MPRKQVRDLDIKLINGSHNSYPIVRDSIECRFNETRIIVKVPHLNGPQVARYPGISRLHEHSVTQIQQFFEDLQQLV